MKIGPRVLSIVLFALPALFFVAGCERSEGVSFTAEVDESSYRRAKELLRQGRNQEALSEFEKVIEKRGANNAPEAHLELGLLYQNHIRDPIAAIYHYRRYLELKPNVHPQDELVKQRIDAATREFARTLPAQPLENLERFDNSDVVQRLQRENEQLKSELARAHSLNGNKTRADAAGFGGTDSAMTETNGPAHLAQNDSSPISGAAPDVDTVTESAPALPPPIRNAVPTPTPIVATPVPARASAGTRPSAGGKRHVIGKGDTLYSLAQRYYGNRSRWRDIFEANRDILKSKDDALRIGVEIKIP